MLAPTPRPEPPFRLADRLATAQRKSFVGRQPELEILRLALLAPEPAFAVLHLYGPGGVGKTALLGEYAHLAAESGVPVVLVDGRNLDPSPPDFLQALRQELDLAENVSPVQALAGLSRGVLLVDTYESLAPLDGWLRERFLPQLPEQILVVIAGRNAPATGWRTDPGWRDLVRVVSLRNLRPEESLDYLNARGIPEARHQRVLEFTYGHPLALSLVADVLTQGDDLTQFSPESEPDVVKVLLDRFVRQVPSARHRQALEVCAHMRVTTEDLLADALATEDAHELFDWLRGLSFIEQGVDGLFPHDLARDVLDADLRWRSPDRYRQLHRQVRGHILNRIQGSTGIEQQRALFDLLALHRNSPIMSPYNDWETLGAAYAEPATSHDLPEMLEMVHRYEGKVSARIAERWFALQPGTFSAFRDASRELVGFEATLALHEATAEDLAADPATEAAMRFVQRYGPVRPGEEIIYHRFHSGRETYQTVSLATNLMAASCAMHWLTRSRLAWSFIAMADPDYWHAPFSYLNLQRSPEAGFSVGGHRYTVYTHDWRAEPALSWIELMGEREITLNLTMEQLDIKRPAPLVVLSQPEFERAVRHALRDYTRPEAMASNPLLRSRLAVDHATDTANAATLQGLIREAAETLKRNPKDEKLYRAIHHTYLNPAATQELAAELLDLPFSTYRYHLTAGVGRITAWLWKRELYGPDG